MTTYKVPLTPEAQVFTIDLAGIEYEVSLTWNFISANWNIDLRKSDKTPVILGIPLVSGIDLLEQFSYLGIGGKLILDSEAGYADLGVTKFLYFTTG